MEALHARSNSFNCQKNNEEAYREAENDFDLSMREQESFIALLYVRGLTYLISLE